MGRGPGAVAPEVRAGGCGGSTGWDLNFVIEYIVGMYWVAKTGWPRWMAARVVSDRWVGTAPGPDPGCWAAWSHLPAVGPRPPGPGPPRRPRLAGSPRRPPAAGRA